MNGLLTKEDFLKYMEQLFVDATHAKDKVQIYLYVYNKLVDHEAISIEFPAYFNLTMDALYNDFIIRTAKLFDTHKDSYGTVYKFLNLIEVNIKLFTSNEKLIQRMLEEQREFLDKNKPLINIIRTWRDKYYAHTGKEYFLASNREKLGYDAPMNYGDIIKLNDFIISSINEYSLLLSKTKFTNDDQIIKEVDKIFAFLHST